MLSSAEELVWLHGHVIAHAHSAQVNVFSTLQDNFKSSALLQTNGTQPITLEPTRVVLQCQTSLLVTIVEECVISSMQLKENKCNTLHPHQCPQ